MPLGLVYVPAAYLCYLSLAMRPGSPYDQLRHDVRFAAQAV